MHGEITAIRHCTDVLTQRGISPQEILAAWKEFSLYTNGEPCPMCASAIRWAGFKEVIYGSSIKTIAKRASGVHLLLRNRRAQPDLYPLECDMGKELLSGARHAHVSPSCELAADDRLGNVLTNETDVFFAHQFNESAPCRESAELIELTQRSGVKGRMCLVSASKRARRWRTGGTLCGRRRQRGTARSQGRRDGKTSCRYL
jgi:tRNA(Arg) A34 adenosine deaminase TadA